MIEACQLASYIGWNVTIYGAISAGAGIIAYEMIGLYVKKRRRGVRVR